MPYAPTSWSGTTGINTARLSNMDGPQYTEATNSFEQDLFTPFVFSGLVATKDGSVVNQLDTTAGVAFLKQSDSTLRRRAPVASTASQFLTSTPSTTYFLDLNPDGTWSFATSHSAQANYLTVCSLTTDGSGNILAVTDARTLSTTLLSGMIGVLQVGTLATGALELTGGPSGSVGKIDYEGTYLVFRPPETGASVQGHVFQTWTGAATENPFSIGGQFGVAAAWVDNSGRFHDNAGLVVVEGANNSITPLKISAGTTLPGTLGSREIFILLT